jgi:outer membrane scaffolding protein for murein synthesis (MipA/OmpV family)
MRDARAFAVGVCCALVQGVCAAESNGDEKFEASYGLTRTNQSLINGVLIHYQTDPTLNLAYENTRGFASIQNGVGFWLVRNAQLKTGLSANYMMGRNQSADKRYVGMGSVSGAPTAYVWSEWQPVKDALTFYANYGKSLSDTDAALAQWGFTLGLPITRKLNFFLDHSRSWGSNQYIRQYYGVTASQSITSGYREFTPTHAGLLYKNTQIGLVLEAHKNVDVILGYGTSTASNTLMHSQLLDRRSQPITTFVLNQRFNSN